ncbi:hypothetical protein EOD39_6337 [Acipenser ruthenus]|uniref:Uncharacterized protein n=1 Tax=Acipenser ruthenus TaxID=7906 RepID=A0A444UAG4_ACIRT|nr:hypothetical protein EOD39_6337 [Acipenser ruthenus]
MEQAEEGGRGRGRGIVSRQPGQIDPLLPVAVRSVPVAERAILHARCALAPVIGCWLCLPIGPSVRLGTNGIAVRSGTRLA